MTFAKRYITRKTIFVATVWYRDSDPLFSVAGYNQEDVKARAIELMKDQQEKDAEDDDGVFPLTDLCWSGVNAWSGKEAHKNGCLGLTDEDRANLAEEGITVY